MKTLQITPLAALIVATALLAPGLVSAGADIVSDTPPPAPRVEQGPPHRVFTRTASPVRPFATVDGATRPCNSVPPRIYADFNSVYGEGGIPKS
jgi:hypothetical protein